MIRRNSKKCGNHLLLPDPKICMVYFTIQCMVPIVDIAHRGVRTRWLRKGHRTGSKGKFSVLGYRQHTNSRSNCAGGTSCLQECGCTHERQCVLPSAEARNWIQAGAAAHLPGSRNDTEWTDQQRGAERHYLLLLPATMFTAQLESHGDPGAV